MEYACSRRRKQSYASARPRAVRAVQQIYADGPGEVLVVSHEMIGRLLRMELCGLTELCGLS